MQITEQLSLFGEEDTEGLVIWWLVTRWEKARAVGWGDPGFEKWIRDLFSTFQGGSCSFANWSFYEFSSRGLRLTSWKDGYEEFIPKAKILKRFGIKEEKR